MYISICIMIMALVTYIPRVLPFAIFGKNIKSRFIKSVLYYMPYAVLAAMTFPGVLYSTNNILYAFIGMIVALILAYFEKSLIIVALSAVFIIYLLNFTK